jgi:hypothetical protein
VADSNGAHHHYIHCDELISFDLEDDNFRRGRVFSGHWPGAVSPILSFTVDRLNALPDWLNKQ